MAGLREDFLVLTASKTISSSSSLTMRLVCAYPASGRGEARGEGNERISVGRRGKEVREKKGKEVKERKGRGSQGEEESRGREGRREEKGDFQTVT